MALAEKYTESVDREFSLFLDDWIDAFLGLKPEGKRKLNETLISFIREFNQYNQKNNKHLFPRYHSEILRVCSEFSRSRIKIIYVDDCSVAAEVRIDDRGQVTSLVIDTSPEGDNVIRFMTQNNKGEENNQTAWCVDIVGRDGNYEMQGYQYE